MSTAQTYRYVAYGENGRLVEGQLQAVSRDDAIEALWKRGLTPLEADQDGGLSLGQWSFSSLVSRRKPTSRDIALFTREFATLAEAGIPVDDALRILNEQLDTGRIQPIVAGLLEAVLDGAHVSDAMAKRADVFSSDYVNIVRAGEASGGLGRVLDELAELLEHRQEIADKFTSALIYPCILLVVAAVSVGVVMGILVPALAPLFSDNGRPMPTIIAFMLRMGELWPVILAVVLVAGLAGSAVVAAIARSPELRLASDRLYLRLPILGPVSNGLDVARFARTLGLLLRSGVSMLAAMTSACTVVRNSFVASRLQAATETIRDGQSLARALSGQPGIPSVCVRMVAVGEETGKLDYMMVRIAVMMERQSRRRIERLMTMLTPAMTIAIAGLIGVLIFTVMNAILSVNDLVVR